MARLFDGSDDYLTKAAAIFSGVAADDYNITLAAWVRPDDRHEGVIMGADDGSTNTERFNIWSRNGYFALRYTGSYIQTGSVVYSNSNTTWFHIAGVFEYDDRILYVDGASEATDTTNTSLDMSGADNFYIGRDRTGKYFDGAIAEAAAYSVSLSASEIASLSAGVSPLLVNPDALIGYWPLGGAYTANDADTDLVGGHALTANGSPAAAGEAHPPVSYPSLPIVIAAAAGGQAARAMHHYRMLRCS